MQGTALPLFPSYTLPCCPAERARSWASACGPAPTAARRGPRAWRSAATRCCASRNSRSTAASRGRASQTTARPCRRSRRAIGCAHAPPCPALPCPVLGQSPHQEDERPLCICALPPPPPQARDAYASFLDRLRAAYLPERIGVPRRSGGWGGAGLRAPARAAPATAGGLLASVQAHARRPARPRHHALPHPCASRPQRTAALGP